MRVCFFLFINYNFDYQLLGIDYQTSGSVRDHQTNTYSYNVLCSLKSWIL